MNFLIDDDNDDKKNVLIQIIGAQGVGKSSFSRSFGEGVEVIVDDPTLNERYIRDLYIDKKMIQVHLIDTSTLSWSLFISEQLTVNVVLCLFSLKDKKTFDILKQQQKEIASKLQFEVIWVVVGSLADENNFTNYDEIHKFCEKLNARYYEISLIKNNMDITSIIIQACYDFFVLGNQRKRSTSCIIN